LEVRLEDRFQYELERSLYVLRCPHCGGNNTHHFSMTYERNEDDPEKDIAISFRCEGCLELTFAQHKGETLVKWPEPV
jgi:phage terminase large subunit GpA-like protein